MFGVRKSRRTDSFLKRFTANCYYKLLSLFGYDVIRDHADFRLMSHRALVALSQYKEVNLFLRGIAKNLGFKTDKVYYDRKERMQGESKYSVKKMLRLADNGIISNSKLIKII